MDTINKLINLKVAIWFIVVGFLLFFIFIGFALFKADLFNINSQVDMEKLSQLGDAVGGISGSIWALSGVILFYLTLNHQINANRINQSTLDNQIETYKNQSNEFLAQRKEMIRSSEAQEKTGQALNDQIELRKKIMEIENIVKVCSLYSDLANLEENESVKIVYKHKCAEKLGQLESKLKGI